MCCASRAALCVPHSVFSDGARSVSISSAVGRGAAGECSSPRGAEVRFRILIINHARIALSAPPVMLRKMDAMGMERGDMDGAANAISGKDEISDLKMENLL